jgi:hypothetical protein
LDKWELSEEPFVVSDVLHDLKSVCQQHNILPNGRYLRRAADAVLHKGEKNEVDQLKKNFLEDGTRHEVVMRGDGTMRFAAWTCPAGELELENREVEEVQVDGTWIGHVAKLLALVTFSSDGVLLPLSYVMYFDQDESTYNAALSSIRGLLRVR